MVALEKLRGADLEQTSKTGATRTRLATNIELEIEVRRRLREREKILVACCLCGKRIITTSWLYTHYRVLCPACASAIRDQIEREQRREAMTQRAILSAITTIEKVAHAIDKRRLVFRLIGVGKTLRRDEEKRRRAEERTEERTRLATIRRGVLAFTKRRREVRVLTKGLIDCDLPSLTAENLTRKAKEEWSALTTQPDLLMQRVNQMVPASLPQEYRDDAIQDIVLSIYEGTADFSDMRRFVAQTIQKNKRSAGWFVPIDATDTGYEKDDAFKPILLHAAPDSMLCTECSSFSDDIDEGLCPSCRTALENKYKIQSQATALIRSVSHPRNAKRSGFSAAAFKFLGSDEELLTTEQFRKQFPERILDL